MEVTSYTVTNTDEFEGELDLVVEHKSTEYELQFEFQRRGTPPHAHSPFPSPDKEIYAWPTEEIPSELKFDAGTEEAATLVFGVGLPEGINLLPDHYENVESGNRSPFVNYPDD